MSLGGRKKTAPKHKKNQHLVDFFVDKAFFKDMLKDFCFETVGLRCLFWLWGATGCFGCGFALP